jgi:mitochondrial chaperone BCS1
LERLFHSVPGISIVLIEDIDVLGLNRKGHHSPHPDGSRKTLSGLLNTLDGASAQEGQIVILATNQAEVLDPALIRPGRIDKKFFIGKMKKEAVKSMFLGMFAPAGGHGKAPSSELIKHATEFSELIPEDTYSPAELQVYLLGNLGYSELAILNFPKWVHKKDGKESGTKPGEKKKDEESTETETTNTKTQTD